MISLMKVPYSLSPHEPLDLEIRFTKGMTRSYPKSVLTSIGVNDIPLSLDTTPELFELLIHLKKKCLHEIAGGWMFENPRLYEDLQSLIRQLYKDQAPHPFPFLQEELSVLTLEQADTILRSFANDTKMEERKEEDTIVRFCAEEIPFLVKAAKNTLAKRYFKPEYFIKLASLNHEKIRCERSLKRKEIKLSSPLSPAQKTRLEQAKMHLLTRIDSLKREIEKVGSSVYTGSSNPEKALGASPIVVKFGNHEVTYPPSLREHLYDCQFLINGKPREFILTLEKKEHFECYLKLIEGIPLRKQLRDRLCKDLWLHEGLVRVSRCFIEKRFHQIDEALRYITLEEADEISSKNQNSYLAKVAEEVIHLAKYFPSKSDASRFFKERAEQFDEVERLKRKFHKNRSRLDQKNLETAREKLDLMEHRLKLLPLSIQGLHHFAQNAPEKMDEPLAKIEAYKNEVLSLLSLPEHLKTFVHLFDYYGFAIKKIDKEVVISFCGIQDFELDFEYASGFEFENELRKQIEWAFYGAGNGMFKSRYKPITEEELIKAHSQIYRDLPRLINKNEITISLTNDVLIAREAFKAGNPSFEHLNTLIKVNNWNDFHIKPEEIKFEKEIESDANEVKLKCRIKNHRFIINPITLRAPLEGLNMIKTKEALKRHYSK